MLAKVIVGLFAISGAIGVELGLLLQQYGVAVVSVEEKSEGGMNLFLPVPLALVPIAFELAPENELRELRLHLNDTGPLVEAVLGELSNCPDVVLVEVHDGGETVLVEKRGDRLIVFVDTPSERVRLNIPLWGVSRIVRQLTNIA